MEDINSRSTIAQSDIIEQAKQMEEEQIMEAHYAPKYGCFSEQYYNETYKKELEEMK